MHNVDTTLQIAFVRNISTLGQRKSRKQRQSDDEVAKHIIGEFMIGLSITLVNCTVCGWLF